MKSDKGEARRRETTPSASSSGSNSNTGLAPMLRIPPEEVALAAYFRWESGGCAPDTADDDWLMAERALMAERDARDAVPISVAARNGMG